MSRALTICWLFIACAGPRPHDAAVSDDAGVSDSGVFDGGQRDSGVCSRCPERSPCDEINGCAYVCNGCESDSDCLVSQYCKDKGRISAFCTRRLPDCASVGDPERAIFEVFLSNASCTDATALCVFRAEFVAASNTSSLTVIEESVENGMTTHSLGAMGGVDLPSLWMGVDRAVCVSSSSFDGQIGCFTHAGRVRVSLEAGGQSSMFEYLDRASVQPPAGLEVAINRINLQMFAQARDAGVINW